MLTIDQIRTLCMQGESNRLDFKRDQYLFDNAADGHKAELLKDILSFANSFRNDPAYILIGVEELESKLGKIVGIEKAEVIDDSKIQQFVNEKTNQTIPFETYVIECGDDRVVQVLEIAPCLKTRPFYLKHKNFAQLKKGDVLMRVGSSSHVALPEEIKEMGLQEAEHENSPTLAVKFDIDNQVEDGLLSVVLQSDVSDPPQPSWAKSLSALNGGSDYDHYLWLRDNVSKLHFRLMLENVSHVQVDNLSIQFDAECDDGCVERCDAPRFGSGSCFDIERIKVRKEGILRPGEHDRDADDLYLKVMKDGAFKLTTTIYGKNLPVPLRQSREYAVRRKTVELEPEWIKKMGFVIRDEEDLGVCVKWFVKQSAKELSGQKVDWGKEMNLHWIPRLREVLSRGGIDTVGV